MSSEVFRLKNPNLGPHDYLYHLGISASDGLPEKYGDVKFVCTGGKASRMKLFAIEMYEKLGHPTNSILYENKEKKTKVPEDISQSAGRYSMFKVGPVLIFSHGIGKASLSVALNEVIKLLHYAECKTDVKIIRIGSSGGVGVEPGTVVITDKPYDATLKQQYDYVNLGKDVSVPCTTSAELRKHLAEVAEKLGIPATAGNTISTDGFFEEQCRLDGAFCEYTDEDKLNFLRRAHDDFGVRNFEMECTCLAGLCNRAGLECAIVCPALLNRLFGDIVKITDKQITLWQNRSFQIVGEYIKERYQNANSV